jgi:signal transduction histidine kinase
MSPLRLDDDLLPTSQFSIDLSHLGRESGWLVGEFSLEEMWRMVDAIRLGERGFALVVGLDGALIAHGNPDRKALVAQAVNLKDHPLLAEGDLGSGEYVDSANLRQLGVAEKMGTLGWTVIVEQPTEEAYAIGGRIRQQLTLAAGTALLLMIGTGLVFGRRFIAPIFTLQRGTQALASGLLETRVDIRSEDEFGALGRSFNTMADRLVELQENVKRQERQATFGRVVAGLFHDLNHPIQNIGNNARLILRSDLDEESRQTSRRSIERELATLKRFMDDMLNVAKPQPLERVPVDLNRAAADVVDAMQAEARKVQVEVVGEFGSGPLTIDGDPFALGRVYRNLVTNAIQATPPGGRVIVTTRRDGDYAEVAVADTGCGIPPDRLLAIFDDFMTTKRRGLGLGLATSKRIVEQLEGTIEVKSTVGQGTTFRLRFPVRGRGASAPH